MKGDDLYIIVEIKERWKRIKDYPNYLVSNFGRFRNIKTGKLLKPGQLSTGYCKITFCKNGIPKQFLAHRVVAKYFIGPCPEGYEVNHIDGVKKNNHYFNLEYVTRSENQKHSFRIGLKSHVGEKNSQSILTEKDIREIRSIYKIGMTHQEIADEFGVSRVSITYIINRKNWSYVN